MTNGITETPRMLWPYMGWNATWMAWQQKFSDMVAAQDASVFGNLENRDQIFKQVPNAEIIDDGGTKKLSVASNLILISRTLNVTVTVDMTDDLTLLPNRMIGAVITPGAVGPQETVFELYDSIETDPSIKIFGYVDEDYAVAWFNGARLQYGESSRQIFSFLVTAGSETNKVSVSSADTTPDYLLAKLQSSDGSVTLTTVDAGANEIIDISVPGVGTDNSVAVDSSDVANTSYLESKILGEAGIKLTKVDQGGGNLAIGVEYGDDMTFMVERDSADPLVSGANLVALYTAAKSLTLSATNRAKICLLSGEYDVASTFVMDTNYIDIVCEEEVVINGGDVAPSVSDAVKAGATIEFSGDSAHTAQITCDDMIVRGVNFVSTTYDALNLDCALSSGSYGPNVVLDGCYFSSTSAESLGFEEDFAGTIKNCFATGTMGSTDKVFGGTALLSKCSGTFLPGAITSAFVQNCHGNEQSFAGDSATARSITSSILIGCSSWGSSAFGTGDVVSSRLEQCRNEGNGTGFGYGTVSGDTIFENCFANQLTGPIGTTGGFVGTMKDCNFCGDDSQSIVMVAATGAKFIGCHFKCDDGITSGASSIDAAASSTIEITGCLLENPLGANVGIFDSLYRETNNMPPAPWQNEIVLADLHDNDKNGLSLAAALQYAAIASPGGDAKSATNRLTIKCAAASYNIQTEIDFGSTLDFVDLVGVGVAGKNNWESIPWHGDVVKPATRLYTDDSSIKIIRYSQSNDNKMKNIHIELPANSSGTCLSFDYELHEDSAFENCVFENPPSTVNVASITKANPCVVTFSAGHGVVGYGSIYLSDIGGMVELEDGVYETKEVDSSSVELRRVDSTDFTAYTSGGTGETASSGRGNAFYTLASDLSGYWKNCHFIGLGNMANAAFRGTMIDCSFDAESLASDIMGATFKNCRFGDYALCSEAGYDIDDGTYISGCKFWGGRSLGYTPSEFFSPTIDDSEFFGEYGLGYGGGSNVPQMTGVKALSLYGAIRVNAGAKLDRCKLSNIDPTGSLVVYMNEIGYVIDTMVQETPSSSGVTGVVRFTLLSEHGYKVGDRIVFSNFDDDSTGYEKMNNQCLTISNVNDTYSFDVEMELPTYGGPYVSNGYCSKHGVEIYRSEISNIIAEPYDIISSWTPLFGRLGNPTAGLTVKGNIFRHGPVFDTSWNMSVLVDCTSYDNNLFCPHVSEPVMKIDNPSLSARERGLQFLQGFDWAREMTPMGGHTRGEMEPVTIQLGPYLYDLGSQSDEYVTESLSMTSDDSYLRVIGHGSVMIPETDIDGVSSFPRQDAVCKPQTVIRFEGQSGLFLISGTEDFTLENIHIYSPDDSTLELIDIVSDVRFSMKNVALTCPSDGATIDGISAPGVSPCVVSFSDGNGPAEGTLLYIKDVVGMTELNGNWFKAVNATVDQCDLENLDTTGYTTYVSGGTAEYEQGPKMELHDNPSIRMENCYLSSGMTIGDTQGSVFKNCVIMGDFITGEALNTLVEDVKIAGRTMWESGTVGPTSIFRRCLFGLDAFGEGAASSGTIEDCVGLYNFLGASASFTGKILRCKSYKRYCDQPQGVGDCLVEDVEMEMMCDISAFQPTDITVFRRVVVRDPGGANTAVAIIFATGGSDVYISHSELRNGISTAITNLHGNGFNILT